MCRRRATHQTFDPSLEEGSGGMLSPRTAYRPALDLSQSRAGAWLQPMHCDRTAFCLLVLLAGVLGFFIQTPLDAVFGVCLATIALVIAISDLDRFEIPDAASGLMFVLGLSWVLFSSEADYRAVLDAIVRSGAAAGVLYGVRAVYYRVRGVEGLGLGDVKLAAAGAPWLTWTILPLALLTAVLAAVLLIAFQLIVRANRIERNSAVPLGAFLAPAIWFTWFTASVNA